MVQMASRSVASDSATEYLTLQECNTHTSKYVADERQALLGPTPFHTINRELQSRQFIGNKEGITHGASCGIYYDI